MLAQIMTCRGINGGANHNSCASHFDCEPGRYCSTLASGGNGDCINCVRPWTLEDSPEPMFGPDEQCTEETPQFCILYQHGPLYKGNCFGADTLATVSNGRGNDRHRATGFDCGAYDRSNARLSCSLDNHTDYRNGLGEKKQSDAPAGSLILAPSAHFS
eukprot:SAG31_NODE_15074_length_772_cov_0.988113_1_plen_159_part_00